MAKIVSVKEAAAKITSGSSVMIGGFMTCGTPVGLVRELVKTGVGDLTVIANDTGVQGDGIGMLITADAVTHLIASHIGTNPETGKKKIEGTISVELVPQGNTGGKNPLWGGRAWRLSNPHWRGVPLWQRANSTLL